MVTLHLHNDMNCANVFHFIGNVCARPVTERRKKIMCLSGKIEQMLRTESLPLYVCVRLSAAN